VTADLSPLVATAAECGHPGLVARVVAASPRRAVWFALRGRELLVSERVLERLAPPEACALLLNHLLRRRRLRRLALVVPIGLAAGAVGGAALASAPGATGGLADAWPVGVIGLGLGVVIAAIARQRAVFAADDECVARLGGDPTPLVRALNGMNRAELRLGQLRVPAHPDLHPRAERLARRHKLCESLLPS